jgi:hypothetical protein
MTLLSLVPILAILFPALGMVLPGILKRDNFPAFANQAIAFLIVFFAAVATALVAGQLVGGNFVEDTGIIYTGMHVLLGVDGPFKDLDQFLQSNVNASAKPATPPILNIPPSQAG